VDFIIIISDHLYDYITFVHTLGVDRLRMRGCSGYVTFVVAPLLQPPVDVSTGVVWKIRPPQKVAGGAIFSQAAIVKYSPLGNLFTIAVCEKIAPYCLIVRNKPPRRRLFEWGRFFHVVTKSFLL